jgi:hypothetical protein
MTMPGFSADAALVKGSGQYRSGRAGLRGNGWSAASQVVPSYYMLGIPSQPSAPTSVSFLNPCGPGYSYRCQYVWSGPYERYWECGCFRNFQVALPPQSALA